MLGEVGEALPRRGDVRRIVLIDEQQRSTSVPTCRRLLKYLEIRHVDLVRHLSLRQLAAPTAAPRSAGCRLTMVL